MNKQMHLIGFYMHSPINHTALSWADPDDDRVDGMRLFDYWKNLARTLERGRFDAAFRDDGVSILLIEQNARAALRISDRAYVLENGAVRLHGDASDIAADSRVIEAYLGGPMTNGSDLRQRHSGRAG